MMSFSNSKNLNPCPHFPNPNPNPRTCTAGALMFVFLVERVRGGGRGMKKMREEGDAKKQKTKRGAPDP